MRPQQAFEHPSEAVAVSPTGRRAVVDPVTMVIPVASSHPSAAWPRSDPRGLARAARLFRSRNEQHSSTLCSVGRDERSASRRRRSRCGSRGERRGVGQLSVPTNPRRTTSGAREAWGAAASRAVTSSRDPISAPSPRSPAPAFRPTVRRERVGVVASAIDAIHPPWVAAARGRAPNGRAPAQVSLAVEIAAAVFGPLSAPWPRSRALPLAPMDQRASPTAPYRGAGRPRNQKDAGPSSCRRSASSEHRRPLTDPFASCSRLDQPRLPVRSQRHYDPFVPDRCSTRRQVCAVTGAAAARARNGAGLRPRGRVIVASEAGQCDAVADEVAGSASALAIEATAALGRVRPLIEASYAGSRASTPGNTPGVYPRARSTRYARCSTRCSTSTPSPSVRRQSRNGSGEFGGDGGVISHQLEHRRRAPGVVPSAGPRPPQRDTRRSPARWPRSAAKKRSWPGRSYRLAQAWGARTARDPAVASAAPAVPKIVAARSVWLARMSYPPAPAHFDCGRADLKVASGRIRTSIRFWRIPFPG